MRAGNRPLQYQVFSDHHLLAPGLKVKAALLNAAKVPGQTTPAWDPGYGWGYMDGYQAFKDVGRTRSVLLPLYGSSQWTYQGTAGAEYRFTAVWDRVVNLGLASGYDCIPAGQLEVIAPNGTVYTDSPASPLDNVRSIRIKAPTSGMYTVRLTWTGGQNYCSGNPQNFVVAANVDLQ